MSTQVAKQIFARMKAKNISVGVLEKEAGLKTHAVRNILRGKSKKPSAEILHAVSEVLGCAVKDLLTRYEVFETETGEEKFEELGGEVFKHPTLLKESIEFVISQLQDKNYQLSNQQVFNCIEGIYFHSLQKYPEEIDKAFGEWFIDLTNT